MGGSWREKGTRRYSKNGPLGEILARTQNGKKLFVSFSAVELKASLERILYTDPTITFSTTQGP